MAQSLALELAHHQDFQAQEQHHIDQELDMEQLNPLQLKAVKQALLLSQEQQEQQDMAQIIQHIEEQETIDIILIYF